MNALDINRCFMRFQDRAERITAKQVADTFVSVGPLLALLDSKNNQIMYGRRGTGKTHALRYFQGQKNTAGDLAVYIDAQNIGSNGSIYNDTSISISERATRLLVDVCSAIHHELLEIFTDPTRGWDLAKAAPVMDRFVSGFIESRISGSAEQELSDRVAASAKNHLGAGVDWSPAGLPLFRASISSEDSSSNENTTRFKFSGLEESWIDFNYFSRAVRALADFVAPKRLWLLVDEWTTIPSDIQPYLADLIRRAMFSVPNVTTKIAAIEHRARFKIDRPDGGYVGFELGADINAAINLDDYLVIDNN